MARRRKRIPEIRQFWEQVARHVFRDVEATTDLRLAWKIVVHEYEPNWAARPDDGDGDGAGSGMVGTDGRITEPGRRLSSYLQIWLETPRARRGLPAMADEVDAMGYLADLVQEDVIEEIHGAWPKCPRHSHSLEVWYSAAGEPMWRCPKTPEVKVSVGELALLRNSSA